jgi:hypothetical protein
LIRYYHISNTKPWKFLLLGDNDALNDNLQTLILDWVKAQGFWMLEAALPVVAALIFFSLPDKVKKQTRISQISPWPTSPARPSAVGRGAGKKLVLIREIRVRKAFV